MRRVAAILLGAALFASSARSRADEPAPPDAFDRGVAALASAHYDQAIAEFESLADRAPPHPDASCNRGLAYAGRVKSGAEHPGDLGRAAAAFEEALVLRPDDAEARHALELVRAEVARRRARSGQGVERATPSLDRALVGLATPRTWSLAAIVAGWVLALGLLLRRRSGSAHLAGTLIVPTCAAALAALVPIALWSDHLDRNRRPGVLVVREASLTSEDGSRLAGDPIVEGALLELGEVQHDRVRVRYGAREGWIPIEAAQALRVR